MLILKQCKVLNHIAEHDLFKTSNVSLDW